MIKKIKYSSISNLINIYFKYNSTAIGIKCSDGIVMAVEKPQQSKMLVEGSNRRIFGIDKRASVAITGFVADGRQIVNRAREEAESYQDIYGHKIVPSVLSNRIALYVHYFTIHGSLRPFGSTTLLAAYDEDIKEAQLYMVEPTGLMFRYFGCAAGKGANAAKTEVEKILTKRGEAGITCAEAVEECARIMYTIRDPSKDKPFELEMGWLCEASGYTQSLVPSDMVKAAEDKAKTTQDSTSGDGSETTMAS